MNKAYTPSLKPLAQSLRREMTPEENRLWYRFLKTLPCTVKRQKIFGCYIADFYIASANLVIEIDGSQHYEADGLKRDQKRDAFFRENGMRVLRYTNLDINHRFPNVCEDILHHIQE